MPCLVFYQYGIVFGIRQTSLRVEMLTWRWCFIMNDMKQFVSESIFHARNIELSVMAV